MAMESKEGPCPRINSQIYFEMQYEQEADGSTIFHDCACSEMICCAEYDEVACPVVWREYFDSVFGTNSAAELAQAAPLDPAEGAEPASDADAAPEALPENWQVDEEQDADGETPPEDPPAE